MSKASGEGFAKKNIAANIVIQISSVTGNFLIVCSESNYVIDSASLEKDALLVQNKVIELLGTYPLNKFTTSNWTQWMQQHHAKIPNVDALSFSMIGKKIVPTMYSELNPTFLM